METIMIVMGIVIGMLAVVFTAYSRITDGIIKDQQREIARLRRDNVRLSSAVRGSRLVQDIKVYSQPIEKPQKPNLRIVRRTEDDNLFGEW